MYLMRSHRRTLMLTRSGAHFLPLFIFHVYACIRTVVRLCMGCLPAHSMMIPAIPFSMCDGKNDYLFCVGYAPVFLFSSTSSSSYSSIAYSLLFTYVTWKARYKSLYIFFIVVRLPPSIAHRRNPWQLHHFTVFVYVCGQVKRMMKLKMTWKKPPPHQMNMVIKWFS